MSHASISSHLLLFFPTTSFLCTAKPSSSLLSTNTSPSPPAGVFSLSSNDPLSGDPPDRLPLPNDAATRVLPVPPFGSIDIERVDGCCEGDLAGLPVARDRVRRVLVLAFVLLIRSGCGLAFFCLDLVPLGWSLSFSRGRDLVAFRRVRRKLESWSGSEIGSESFGMSNSGCAPFRSRPAFRRFVGMRACSCSVGIVEGCWTGFRGLDTFGVLVLAGEGAELLLIGGAMISSSSPRAF